MEDELLQRLLNEDEDENFTFGDTGEDDWDEEDIEDDDTDEDIDDDEDNVGLDDDE